MAHDNKVSFNLRCVRPNFFGGLTFHHLCNRIETQLL
jgi:hypothetical protein